jgi:hypothetical protein
MEQKKIRQGRKTFIFSIGMLLILSGYGQSTGKGPFMKAMEEMIGRYRESKYLSFDVTYRYASEQQPGNYLDSLTGSYKLNGSNYWYSLDNTEVVGSKDYSVLLFKEDHVMYLAPPASRGRIDFLSSMDSFLVKRDNIICSLREEEGRKKLLLSFGAGSPCKSIEYSIDKGSGYLTRIRQIVRAGQLYDPAVKNAVDPDSAYAIIEMDFSDYRTGSFDDKLLDTGNYFKKEGQQYVTVAPYDTYKIVLGAPNL